MKVKLVTKRTFAALPNPRPCPLCDRKIRVGQYVLQHRLDAAAFADTTLTIHVACLRPIVERTPEDQADPSTAHHEAQRIMRVLAGD